MVRPARHRQTKGAAMDMPDLTPPRHIPTLPLVVVDTNRSPPFASDIFGWCGADIVVSGPGYLALMIRSDGSRPDDVWFYDGQRVQQLPHRTREQYISRGEAARAAHRYAEAVREFLAVADLSDPRGPSNLADMLLNGEEVNSDLPSNDRIAFWKTSLGSRCTRTKPASANAAGRRDWRTTLTERHQRCCIAVSAFVVGDGKGAQHRGQSDASEG
jgi:hypothetical protein